MQQMQAFPTDAYQSQSRCTGIGIGNFGIATGLAAVSGAGGTAKHYKVHGNSAFGSFSNYMHHGELDSRGMSRVVFNGNNRNDFQCGADNFQNCITSEIIDNPGNYQLNYVNANGNIRYMRQQLNPAFHGDGQMQRCYIQRPQGQQSRFVRVQGSKMRPNSSFRNFNNNNNNNNNNQLRQKQNRRFVTKGFNNYKHHKAGNNNNSDTFSQEGNANSSPQRCAQQQEFISTSEQEMSQKTPPRQGKYESTQSKFTKSYRSANKTESYNRSKKSSSRSPLLRPKLEYGSDAMHDLSYDDITENSDDNDDSDLRERLMRKKHDQVIKREPGELESDEDIAESLREKEAASKRKIQKKRSAAGVADDDHHSTSKKFKSSVASSSTEAKSRESKNAEKTGRKDSGTNYSHQSYSSSYSGHDNRFTFSSSQGDNQIPTVKKHTPKSTCPVPNSFTSTYTNAQNYCCSVEAEVTDLKEKISTMKQSLRETQNKLLEANVIGSKKSLRMQEEITQLKKQLEEATKNENEMKTSLKNFETELSAKNSELTKIALMNEVEKQEKVKLTAELNRTYKERLTIEVEKLRALFDLEVAKMQAFYMSSNIYDDDISMPYTEVSSDTNHPNQGTHTPRNEMLETTENNGEAMNMNQGTINVASQCEYPFMQPYFSTSPQTSVAMPMTGSSSSFSLFENAMAYNSLIHHHHQHVYAQTTAAAAGGTGTDVTGNNITTTAQSRV